MNCCEDDYKGQSHFTSTDQLCTPHLAMVGRCAQALLASGPLLLLLCRDASLVSSFAECTGLATYGSADLVRMGAKPLSPKAH